MKTVTYTEVRIAGAAYYGLLAGLGLGIVGALASAWRMEHYGHYVTGMSNQIVWGLPHVFAVFLIVAASGALNVASLGTVFGRDAYKPLGRLSALLAIALLVGGLAVLVLDLGRPDRLIVAATHYNFKSIFAWNIFLYTGFLAIVAAYVWFQMERRMHRFVRATGLIALIWRLALTTGTGSIFGFLVARQAYDAALMAPLFIAMSLSFGLAIYILVLIGACRSDNRELGAMLLGRLGRLLGLFAAVVLYFTTIQHLTNLYAAEHAAVERFILLAGGVHTSLFWIGQVGLGGLVPMALTLRPGSPPTPGAVTVASALVVLGGLVQIYVIIIGGQAFPLLLFPGMEVTSGFFDGVVASYTPSLPEIGLGLGGVSLAAAIVVLGLRLLRFLPEDLSDPQ